MPSAQDMLKLVGTRLYGYFFLTVFMLIGVFNFFVICALLPLKYLVSPALFQKVNSLQLAFSVPGFCCVPFSWAGAKITSNSFGRLKRRVNEDQLCVGNHSCRVDWLIDMYVAQYYNQRTSFITEAFLVSLPFIGWHRYLCDDMFVHRSFEKDADRLLANIQRFKEYNVKRWLFLAPEGYIADFSNFDRQYIANCESFCKSQGFEPYKFVLTPRYKGQTIFKKLLETNDGKTYPALSGTFNYVNKGKRAVQPLHDKDRVVPDLWTVVSGKMECHLHYRDLDLAEDASALKHQLMSDYAAKDKILEKFYETGKQTTAFPGKKNSESDAAWRPVFDDALPIYVIDQSVSQVSHESGWNTKGGVVDPKTIDLDDETKFYSQELPIEHLKMNASLILQFAGAFYVAKFLGVTSWLAPAFLFLYCMIGFSHILGEFMADGQSRESIPLEGFFKVIMLRYYGVTNGDDKKETKVHIKAE